MMGNAVPDIPRLYTAIAEWLSCGMFVLLIGPRQKKIPLTIASVVYLLGIIVFMELTATITLWLWLPCMLVAFSSMVAFIKFVNQTSFHEAIYYGVMAFSVAECIASLEWQIVRYFYPEVSNMRVWVEILALVVVYGGVLFAFWKLLGLYIDKGKHLNIENKDWIISAFICAVIFGFSNLSFINISSSNMGQYSGEIAYIRTLVDVAGVSMLYAQFLSCHNNMTRRELIAVQNALQNQYAQYKQSRESIDLINFKYHDLKHQIGILREMHDVEQRSAFLDTMEADIKYYELQNKTGNSVLDTLLTGKSIYCNKHGITMTVVADGSLIDFMDAMDICSVFGNALDNAIEAALKIEDKQKRLVHITISQVKSFVMIRIQNYYEGKLIENGDYVLTTKKNAESHGYGLKSIKYSVNRYGGVLKIQSDNNWFEVKVLIPIVEKS